MTSRFSVSISSLSSLFVAVASIGLSATITGDARGDGGVHLTYLWHLEQPIYWPAPNASGGRYQTAWDSIQAKQGGAQHPENNLSAIFGKDDRRAVYQYRVRDAIQGMLSQPNAGAQVSYSGGLIENVMSLGNAGQLGYGSGWADGFKQARQWKTQGGHPRLDIVQFPFHHALLPLVDEKVAAMELALYRQVYAPTWGAGDVSQGLFPSEMAFSERLIPTLVQQGIKWVVVSNAHLSRACKGYPWVAGSGGDNIPPPNRADTRNPAQNTYNRISIDRGVSPANAVPFAYQAHWARYVDPQTGKESKIIVVPAAQGESWQDGYSCISPSVLTDLASHNTPSHPMLLLLAHDGDNAYGGGYSYYMECTPGVVSQAAGQGNPPTTVEQFLQDHPVPASDVVHVEDGAWVNADGDFGAPGFWNWNWPLVNKQGQVDPAGGWAEDERNWAIITAATNEVLTAQAATGAPDLAKVLHPEGGSNKLEQAWHFLLGSLNSGYMYYGKALDMELKPTVACNEAVSRAQSVHGNVDKQAPTIWIPQRYPDNPGGMNFGPLYGYKKVTGSSDFMVWTFAYDVSGVQSAKLRVRKDADGVIGMGDTANYLYAKSAGVGDWVDIPLTKRVFPKGNVFADPEIDVSVLPSKIADVYYATVTGYTEALVDYYVEATDTHGQVARTAIQHVYVGKAHGGSGGGGDPDGVHWSPAQPYEDDVVTIYTPDQGTMHWGVNGWQAPDKSLWPPQTQAAGAQAVDTPLAGPDAKGFYSVKIGPFAGGGTAVSSIEFVVHKADGTWDNNGGQDYHITVLSGSAGAGGTAGAGGAGTGGAEAGTAGANQDGGGGQQESGVGGDAGAGMSGAGGVGTGGNSAAGSAGAPVGGADDTGDGCACGVAVGRSSGWSWWAVLGLVGAWLMRKRKEHRSERMRELER